MPPRRQLRNRRTEEPMIHEGRQEDPTQAFVDRIAEAMTRNCSTNFKDFKTAEPPEFRGTTDPLEAQIWIEEIEKVFDVTHVAEDQKTSFATFMMKGEANYWWKVNKSRAGDEIITWTRFKGLFLENYFPDSIKARMEIKFLELKQENMSVQEYVAKFNKLARYAPHQVDTEERKARRFEQGLNPELYSKVAVFQTDSFASVLEKSIIAEGGNEALKKYRMERKRKVTDEGRRKGKDCDNKNSTKNNSNRDSRGMLENDPKRKNKCKNCGKKHSGECMKGKNLCYNCGCEGHIAPNCPKPKKHVGCFACGSTGHQFRNCPKKKNNKGNYSKSWNSKFKTEGPVKMSKSKTQMF